MQSELTEIRKVLINYACTFTRNREDARDLVHDIMLKVWEKGWHKDNNLPPIPYLKTMVYNYFRDEIKRQSRIARGSHYIDLIAEISEDRNINKNEHLELIWEFVLKHKYGYIFIEMVKREMLNVKDLAPYLNEKKDNLYKKHQKLVKDLKTHIKP